MQRMNKMICMFMGFIHMICIAFGFEGFVKEPVMLFMAAYIEIGLIDLPFILGCGTKKGVF